MPASIVRELIGFMIKEEDSENVQNGEYREDDSMKMSDVTNYIIVILSRIKNLTMLSIDQLEKISLHLASQYTVVTNEKIKFVKIDEDSSSSNNDATLISSIASKLVLANVEMAINKSKHVSARTVGHLVHALQENIASNKQTRIAAAKCLHLLSSKKQLSYSREMLGIFYDLIASEVYDISVYMQATYTSCLHQQSTAMSITDEASEPLEASAMENVNELFQLNENGSKGSLKLADVDFADIINEQVLDILECEAGKRYKFENEKLFTLMEAILYMTNDDESAPIYVSKVLDIINIYK